MFLLALDRIKVRRTVSDLLVWSFCPNGAFSVRSFRRCIEDVGGVFYPNLEAIWKGLSPPKVELFVW